MSKVHDAMRALETKSAPEKSTGSLNSLVGALIDELAHDVPDDAHLEMVRADLAAVSRTYEESKKKDVALRFYLATRALLREYELLKDRLRKAEKAAPAHVPEPEPAPLSDLAHSASNGHS